MFGTAHDLLFIGMMLLPVVLFVGALILLAMADVSYIAEWSNAREMAKTLLSTEIRSAFWLSIWTTGLTTLLGLLLAVPIGYSMSRFRLPMHALWDSIIDLPIILPPLVVGLSLLVFFQTSLGRAMEGAGLRFAFEPQGIILCQLLVSSSLGIRVMRLTFDNIDPRYEQVALTLGCNRWQAFFRVTLPIAWRGVIISGILIWTRAFGIFGPLMVFVGAVRNRTEVLPTTIYLEQSVGHIEVALAVAMLMVLIAITALVLVRIVAMPKQ